VDGQLTVDKTMCRCVWAIIVVPGGQVSRSQSGLAGLASSTWAPHSINNPPV
jgi:hypothetical protein